jgi:hypothetical protein
MIIDGCLKRDYCAANCIDSASHFSMVRHEFERYRDRFGSNTGVVVPVASSDDVHAPARPSIVACIACVASLVISCVAMLSWYALVR